MRCSSGMPVAEARSVSATGSSLSSTRSSRSAPRSTAATPWAAPSRLTARAAWNSCSMLVILRRAAFRSSPNPRRTACSSMPCPATRSSARRRWTSSTAGGGASSPSSGSSSCCRRRSRSSALPARRSSARTASSSTRSSSSSRWRRRRGEFELQARNPAKNLIIGGDHMAFAPVYGCPFIREGDVRRDAKMADFENLVKLVAVLRRARLAGRHDLRAGGPAAGLAPPRHGLRAADADATSRTWARSPPAPTRPTRSGWARSCSAAARRSNATPVVDLADQRQLAAALRRPHARRRCSST